MTTRTAKAGLITRRMIIAMVAMGIIALALGYFVHPVYATVVGDKVDIHQDLPIDSSTFDKDADCGDFDSGVVWHFILNKYDPNDAQLFVTFASAGSMGPISETDSPATAHHFYVNTPSNDSLTDAYVILPGGAGDAQLQLSHVCNAGEAQSVPPSAEQSVAASVSASVPASVAASVPASAEGSVKAGTGTPAASTSNTALFGNGSSPLPTIAFSLILLASLGALAYANVKSVRS